MFEDCDDDDDGGDGAADVHAAASRVVTPQRAPLSHRQRNAEQARHAQQQRPRSRPPELAVNKVKAAQDFLACGLRTSLRSFSDKHDVTFEWARRLLMTAGSVLLDEQREACRRLLLDVEAVVSQGNMRAVLFTWWRSYDETPRLCRLDSMNADGTLESESGHAKIMCALLGFSMTLQVRGSHAGVETWRSHIIHGTLECELVPVANQTIPLVANYVCKKLCLPPGCQEIVFRLFCATATSSLHRHAQVLLAGRAR